MREFEEHSQNHIQWSAVKEVAASLKSRGFLALLAGGCVRDFLMNRAPNDFDIATDATPDQVAEIFPRALTVGKAFGVTILPYDGFQLEVATFRQDLDYKDGRRPEGVRFTTPEEDAKRRDFTVNALFYDLDRGAVIDYVDGQADITKRVIRTVGIAEERFAEDHLRLLRAVRFAAQLDFSIAPETLSAVERLAETVATVSRERVRDEIQKLLKAPNRAHGLQLMIETGLMKALFPKLSDAIEPQAWLKKFAKAEPKEDLTTLLAAFFEPIGLTFLKTELKELRLDNRRSDAVQFVLKNRSAFASPDSLRRGEMVLLLAHTDASAAERFADLHEFTRSAVIDQNRKARIEAVLQALGPDREKPAAFVTGEDAKQKGIKPGAEMGAALREAYLLQLEGKFASKDEALEWLKK